MEKIWVHRANTFEACNKFDRNYYLSMSSTMRLDTVQYLREVYFKMKRGGKSESGKGLRRVVTVIQ